MPMDLLHSYPSDSNSQEIKKEKKIENKNGGLKKQKFHFKTKHTLSLSGSLTARARSCPWEKWRRKLRRSQYGRRWSRCDWRAKERYRSTNRRSIPTRRRFAIPSNPSSPELNKPPKTKVCFTTMCFFFQCFLLISAKLGFWSFGSETVLASLKLGFWLFNFNFWFWLFRKIGELKAKLREAEDDMVKALAGNFDYLKFFNGMFGWHKFGFGFGFEETQIQIFCLDNLKELDLDLAQIHLGFQGSKSMDLKYLQKPRNLEISHSHAHCFSLGSLCLSS